MDANLQSALTIIVPTFAVLLGAFINNSRLADMNSRLADLRAEMNDRFRSQDEKMNARLEAFEQRVLGKFAALDARFDTNDYRFAAIDQRIVDSRETLRSEIRRVEEVVNARLHHLEHSR